MLLLTHHTKRVAPQHRTNRGLKKTSCVENHQAHGSTIRLTPACDIQQLKKIKVYDTHILIDVKNATQVEVPNADTVEMVGHLMDLAKD